MRRRRFLSTVAAPLALMPLARPRPARASTSVNVGVTATISAAPLFVAQDRGFFNDAGLDVRFVTFAAPDDIIAPLAAGQVDAALAVPSAALYNAIGGGATMRVVADMGSATRDFGYNLLVVRKALSDRGAVKKLGDLKGLTIADAAAGTPSTSTLNEALRAGGLTLADVKNVKMSFAAMEAALKAGTIDAALMPDPEASETVDNGYAVGLEAGDAFYLNQELFVLVYSGGFIKTPETALAFMTAYLKGVRFFLDALHAGHFTDKNAGVVIDILRKRTAIKNPIVYTTFTPAGVNPNGTVNTASMAKDLDLMRKQGAVTVNVSVRQCVESRFVNAAVRSLGRV